LRPIITELQVEQVRGEGNELRDALLSVTLNPAVGRTQRIVLLLNEITQSVPMAYSFTANLRETDGAVINVPLQSVRAGTYLVRIQVDGAESLLEVDADPESPTRDQYVRPRVVLP
jgi:hypothetical protein